MVPFESTITSSPNEVTSALLTDTPSIPSSPGIPGAPSAPAGCWTRQPEFRFTGLLVSLRPWSLGPVGPGTQGWGCLNRSIRQHNHQFTRGIHLRAGHRDSIETWNPRGSIGSRRSYISLRSFLSSRSRQWPSRSEVSIGHNNHQLTSGDDLSACDRDSVLARGRLSRGSERPLRPWVLSTEPKW